MKKLLLAAVIAVSATPAFACSYDTDCSPGSKCVKDRYALEGYCAGGMNPGNRNDRQPFRDRMDMTGKRGETCNWDTECGIGGQCAKASGQTQGVCR